jgi:hypothetical protein
MEILVVEFIAGAASSSGGNVVRQRRLKAAADGQ